MNMRLGLVASIVGFVAAVVLLQGCRDEPAPEVQGRFLLEMLRGNEAERENGERWINPAICRDSTDYLIRISSKRGIKVTELPVWVADWVVVANPPADKSAPVLYRPVAGSARDSGTVKVMVVRRDSSVDEIAAETLWKELQERYVAPVGHKR